MLYIHDDDDTPKTRVPATIHIIIYTQTEKKKDYKRALWVNNVRTI